MNIDTKTPNEKLTEVVEMLRRIEREVKHVEALLSEITAEVYK